MSALGFPVIDADGHVEEQPKLLGANAARLFNLKV
jgi:hypothetical protein